MYKNKIKLLEKYISSEEVKDVKQIKIKKKMQRHVSIRNTDNLIRGGHNWI